MSRISSIYDELMDELINECRWDIGFTEYIIPVYRFGTAYDYIAAGCCLFDNGIGILHHPSFKQETTD